MTVLGVGWWFWSLRQQSIGLDEDIARAELQAQQLRSVLAQVQKFEARKAQLQQRVSLIEQLRSGQSAPVHVLDEISKSLPDRLWLTDMTQTGNEFSISGMTTSMTAVSDFIANLEATRWFKRPVEIVDSQVQSDAKVGDLVQVLNQGAVPGSGGAGGGDTGRSGRTWRCCRGRRTVVNDESVAQQAPVARADRRVRRRLPRGGIRLLEVLRERSAGGHRTATDAGSTALRADVDRGVATARQLPQFEEQVNKLEQRLESLRQVLPEEKDVADILRRIQGLATKSNLTIQRFQPGKVVQQKLYAEIPYKLQAEGTYHNLGYFFDQISKFPRIINIGDIALKAKSPAEPNATITADLRGDNVRAARSEGWSGKGGAVPKQPSLGK